MREQDPAEDVLAAAHRRAAALTAGDAGALHDLLHPDFRWTSHRGQTFDRATYIEANTAGSLSWQQQSLSDVHITVVGEVAVLLAVVTDDVTRDGQVQRFRMPVTQTWVRDETRWRCLAGHAGPAL